MDIRLFFFNAILVSSISGKAILKSNSALEAESTVNYDTFRTDAPFPKDEEAAKVQHVRSDSIERSIPIENSEIPEPGNVNIRTKRSYYPYGTTYQVPSWTLGSNQWRPNMYSIQNPYIVSINEFGGNNPSINSQYAYLNRPGIDSNAEKLKTPSDGHSRKKSAPLGFNRKNTNRKTDIKPIMDNSRKEEEDKKPVWDITAYRPGNAKSTRHSRASKRELNPQVEKSPFFILEDRRESQKLIHLTNQYMERNEIPSFAFSIQRSPSPTKCAWAVLSCCSSSSEAINHKCFREMACEEKFWNNQLCSDEFKKAAVETASSFYSEKFKKR